MNNEKYNGWTNYETWKIMLDIFDGFEPPLEGEEISPQFCEEYVYQFLEMDNDNLLTLSYAEAFVNGVNWHEIAEHLNERVE